MRLDKPTITQIIIIINTKIILFIILNLWPIRRWGHSARPLYHNCHHHCITILIINDRNRKSLLFSGKSKLQSWVLITSRSTTWCGGWSWTSTEQRMRCSSWRRSSGGYLFIFVHHFFIFVYNFSIFASGYMFATTFFKSAFYFFEFFPIPKGPTQEIGVIFVSQPQSPWYWSRMIWSE